MLTLSEAIRDGARWIQPARDRAQGYGNALDMARVAVGAPFIFGAYLHSMAVFPCGCTRWISKGRPMRLTLLELVVHVFNEHVCGARDWTVGVLADWLADRENEFGLGDLEYDAPKAFGRLS